jgi:hypothetical protein
VRSEQVAHTDVRHHVTTQTQAAGLGRRVGGDNQPERHTSRLLDDSLDNRTRCVGAVCRLEGGIMPIVADNIDTLILNIKLCQAAEADLITDFAFAGEQLFIKASRILPWTSAKTAMLLANPAS